jgi:hypothetical protein
MFWEKTAKSLYLQCPTTTRGANKNGSERECKLVGPNGERPIHVCLLRANHCPQLIGFQEGVLQGIKDYIEGAELDRQCEIDAQYGKDYCAAVGYNLHRRLVQQPAAHEDGPLPEIAEIEEGLADDSPYLHDLQLWLLASESPSHRCRRTNTDDLDLAADLELERQAAQLEADDLIMLTTCGLYKGETPMIMAIADRDVAMVKWMLNCHAW